eukprot:CAMPEP_0202869216 /NCGR_PEP_ID=MMETSP1391-20130828/12171_1 /ASSEMBLY_ACC=CAM_ASM_000867 /TAXON_ID=1034604 /ORGANISM="Chlamydomonas leiostraca, Strain SAG 11-49" /LENGTH=91 /DNA_ID=CAMNT_0049549509 /DNA_START=70 /DNA_END=345 /DNA_ORIENTATION=+
MPGLGALMDLLPDGKAGLAIKVAVALVGIVWWTSAPGADEASDFKGKAEKRRGYNRHYALKGRGRKEAFRQSTKDNRSTITPTREYSIAVK